MVVCFYNEPQDFVIYENQGEDQLCKNCRPDQGLFIFSTQIVKFLFQASSLFL